MTDLVDFLSARIAEDELDATDVHEIDCDLVRHGLVDPGFGWTCSCGRPGRVLAECAAKRDLVQLMVDEVRDARRRSAWTIPDSEVGDKGRDYRSGFEGARAQQLPDVLDRTARVLRLLALPYSDHPDYAEARRGS